MTPTPDDTGRRRAEAVERLIELRILYGMNTVDAQALAQDILAARDALADAMRPTPSDSFPVETYEPRGLTNWWRPPTEGNP